MKLNPALLFPLLLMTYFPVHAQSPQFREDIRQIVEITLPSQKAIDTVLIPFFARTRPNYPNIDNSRWQSITGELRDFMLSEVNAPNGFIDTIIGSYQRRLTEKEAQEIARFFQSDAGRQFIQQRDEVLVELFPALNTEVRRLTPKLDSRFNELIKKHGL